MKLKFCSRIAGVMFLTFTLNAQSADLFSYSAPDGKSGLRLAWRADASSDWQPIDENFNFVSSDFGPWGSHKTMFSPQLFINAADSLWTCVWSATSDGSVTALTTSPDLFSWTPQRYFANKLDLPRDMRPATPITADSVLIGGKMMKGFRQTVDNATIDRIKKFVADRGKRGALFSQHAKDDATRFANLSDVSFTATANPSEAKRISDKLIGIFFEDINYGADGGLYGELLQNRDFEYIPSDRHGDQNWNSTHSWSATDDGSFSIATDNPNHPNNPHYGVINGAVTLTNAGYDGISVKKGEKYRVSLAIRSAKPMRLSVTLTTPEGAVIGNAAIKTKGGDSWTTYKTLIKATRSVSGAKLNVNFPKGSDASVDMVSLFPVNTFKGRENGLRQELA